MWKSKRKLKREIIAKYIDYKGKIIFDTKYEDGANVKILDNSNFKKIFPDFIFTDIRAGIKESAEYYLNPDSLKILIQSNDCFSPISSIK